MARTIKEYDRAARRNEILDAAQRFVYTKGYEQMTIHDILDELHISKGAFYHYFDSKQDLLEALIERLLDEAEQRLNPIVQDSSLSAFDKLERYFEAAARWKTDRKDFMLALLRVWYADHNAIVRQKVFALTVKRITPIISEIIRQGIREGVINTPYPDQAGELFLSLWQTLGEVISRLLLTHDADFRLIHTIVAAYNDAVERILGAAPGTLRLIDPVTLDEWFVYVEAQPRLANQALA